MNKPYDAMYPINRESGSVPSPRSSPRYYTAIPNNYFICKDGPKTGPERPLSRGAAFLPNKTVPPSGKDVPRPGKTVPLSGKTVPPSGKTVPRPGKTLTPSGKDVPPSGKDVPPSGKDVPRPGKTLTLSGKTLTPSNKTVIRWGNAGILPDNGIYNSRKRRRV
jgi:hypothetical protein